jgi:hypothetical protein
LKTINVETISGLKTKIEKRVEKIITGSKHRYSILYEKGKRHECP